VLVIKLRRRRGRGGGGGGGVSTAAGGGAAGAVRVLNVAVGDLLNLQQVQLLLKRHLLFLLWEKKRRTNKRNAESNSRTGGAYREVGGVVRVFHIEHGVLGLIAHIFGHEGGQTTLRRKKRIEMKSEKGKKKRIKKWSS
jgi:hypothetical protein